MYVCMIHMYVCTHTDKQRKEARERERDCEIALAKERDCERAREVEGAIITSVRLRAEWQSACSGSLFCAEKGGLGV